MDDPNPWDASLIRLQEALRAEIRSGAAEMRQHLDATAGETRRYVAGSADETRQHVDATAVETRRHFDVVAEDLRSDVRLMAEGLSALDEKVDRFREEVREQFGKVDRRFLHLEARVARLEDR